MKQALINAHIDLPAIVNHNEDIVVPCSGTSNHSVSGNYRLVNPFNVTVVFQENTVEFGVELKYLMDLFGTKFAMMLYSGKFRSFLQFSWSSIISFLYFKLREIDYFQRRR